LVSATVSSATAGSSVVVDRDDRAVQPANGDDLVTRAELVLHGLRLAAPLLLRADHQEIDHAEEQEQEQDGGEAVSCSRTGLG